MTINTLTITSRASAAYQVGEASITISDIQNNEDITKAKNLVVNKSIEVLNDIIAKTGVDTKETPKVEVKETKAEYNRQYNKTQQQYQQRRPATEAQLQWLINNNEFTKERSLMSSKELGLLIADLRREKYGE